MLAIFLHVIDIKNQYFFKLLYHFFSFCIKFPPRGTPEVPLSSLEPPKLDFYRFWTLLGTPLGAQVGSNFEPLARPGAS